MQDWAKGSVRCRGGGEVGVEQQVCEVGARAWERREGHRRAWRSLMSQVSVLCNPHQHRQLYQGETIAFYILCEKLFQMHGQINIRS